MTIQKPLIHRTFFRTARWGLPLLVAMPFVGCSSAPDSENPVSQAAALDPSNVMPTTTYTVTMWAQVNDAREPTAAAPQPEPSPAPPGTCWQPNTLGDCSTDNVCGNYACWTTDTGYQLWGELAARVTKNNVPGGSTTDNGVGSACPLTTPANLGVYTWNTYAGGPLTNPNAANVTTCSGQANQTQYGGPNGPFIGGSALTTSVTIGDPTDTIALAAVLDNIEQTPPAQVAGSTVQSSLSQLAADLSTGSTAESNGAKIVDIALTSSEDVAAVAAITSVVGTIPAVVTAGAAIANLAWPSPTANDTPGQHESCVGGIFARGDGTATDTLMMQLNGAQLDAVAQTGAELQFHSAGSWAATSDGNAHCESDITIHITVARQWGTGLAAAPRSGDFAIVSAPNQMDTFVVPGKAPAGADSAAQFVRVHGDGTSWSAPETTDGWPVYNSWYEGGVSTATVPAIAQTAAPTPQGTDLFVFWAGSNGQLYEYPFNHTSTGSGPLDFGYATSIFNRTFSSPGTCFVNGFPRLCWHQGPLLPSNAHVAAVSRGRMNLDAFFIDAQGNLWNAWSADGGQSWGNTQVTTDGAGVPGSPVSAIARTGTSLDVYFLGHNGLEHASWAEAPWAVEVASGTASIAPAGGYLSAIAQSVANADVFFTDTSGSLWRAYTAYPSQPKLLAAKIGPGGVDGAAGGPIAAVSRQPGVMDVVLQSTNASNGATWYSTTNDGQSWARGAVPVGDASRGISIVAPSSYELRVFTYNYLGNVYTSDWVSAGVPSWSQAFGVQVLNFPTIPVGPIGPIVRL